MYVCIYRYVHLEPHLGHLDPQSFKNQSMDTKAAPKRPHLGHLGLDLQAPCPRKPFSKKNVRRRCLRLRVQSCAAPLAGRPLCVKLNFPMYIVLILWYLSYSLYPKG